jgi:hypothetical protein
MPPWDVVWDLLRHAIVPAFAVAAMVAAAVDRIGGPKQARTGAALGLIAGVALGFYWSNTLPFINGNSEWNRLPWAALIALCVGRAAHAADDRWFLQGAASFGLAWWVIPERIHADLPWLVVALAALIWSNWVLLELLAEQPDGAIVGVGAALAFLVAGGVLVFAGSAKFMEAAIILAMATAGVSAIGWRRRFAISAALPAVAVLLPGLLIMGNRETVVETIHWAAFVLPALAPLFLAVSIPISAWPKHRRIAFQFALFLVPLVIAMLLARQGGSLDFGEPDW